MIEWVWPYVLLLAPLPALLRWLWRPLANRQAALTVPDVDTFRLQPESALAGRSRRLPWRPALLWLAWLALLAAAARPQWTGEPVTLPTTGRDLMLAVGHLRQHGHRGHATRRSTGGPSHRGQAGGRGLRRSPARRPGGADPVRHQRLPASAPDLRSRQRRAAAERGAGGASPAAKPPSATPSAWRSSACAPARTATGC